MNTKNKDYKLSAVNQKLLLVSSFLGGYQKCSSSWVVESLAMPLHEVIKQHLLLSLSYYLSSRSDCPSFTFSVISRESFILLSQDFLPMIVTLESTVYYLM